jgi:hypothetical protein
MAKDKAAAKQAFALIGDKPGAGVWHHRDSFLEARGDCAIVTNSPDKPAHR